MKQQEEAKQTAEIESQEETNRQRIVAQASAMHARLEQEALQLEEALHADMHRKHEMVRTWFEAAMRKNLARLGFSNSQCYSYAEGDRVSAHL